MKTIYDIIRSFNFITYEEDNEYILSNNSYQINIIYYYIEATGDEKYLYKIYSKSHGKLDHTIKYRVGVNYDDIIEIVTDLKKFFKKDLRKAKLKQVNYV